MQASRPNARWTWEPAKGRQGSEKGAPAPVHFASLGTKRSKGPGAPKPSRASTAGGWSSNQASAFPPTFTGGDHRTAPVQKHQACYRATPHAAWRLALTSSASLHPSRARTQSGSASPGGCHWRPRVCLQGLPPAEAQQTLPPGAGDYRRPAAASQCPAAAHMATCPDAAARICEPDGVRNLAGLGAPSDRAAG